MRSVRLPILYWRRLSSLTLTFFFSTATASVLFLVVVPLKLLMICSSWTRIFQGLANEQSQ